MGKLLSFLYVCMVNTIYLLSFVETPRKFIIAELSIRKLGSSSSSDLLISTDEDPSLRIESSAIINLRGVSTKLNKGKLLFRHCAPIIIISFVKYQTTYLFKGQTLPLRYKH